VYLGSLARILMKIWFLVNFRITISNMRSKFTGRLLLRYWSCNITILAFHRPCRQFIAFFDDENEIYGYIPKSSSLRTYQLIYDYKKKQIILRTILFHITHSALVLKLIRMQFLVKILHWLTHRQKIIEIASGIQPPHSDFKFRLSVPSHPKLLQNEVLVNFEALSTFHIIQIAFFRLIFPFLKYFLCSKTRNAPSEMCRDTKVTALLTIYRHTTVLH
jgi:hypothetical protein